MSDQPKRLYRSRSDRKFFGVMGGLANYFGLDASLVRIAYLVLTVLTLGVPGIALYVAMVFIVPTGPETQGQP